MTETLAGRCPYPAAVAALPVCPKRKLPIPFSAARDDDHPEIGMFTIADPDKVETCWRYNLCGVCGQPLGYWIAFLGGPGSAGPNGAYQDPAMHEECAEAALALCPYIAHRKVPRRTPTVKVMAAQRGDYYVADKRTDGQPWVMVVTRSYKTRFEPTEDGGEIRLFFPDHTKARYRSFAYGAGDSLAEVTG